MTAEVEITSFVKLSESQNENFDREYHSAKELSDKFSAFEGLFHDEPFSVLDLGGGNGWFADRILARFPNATVTVLDVSELLLARNTASPRKEVIHGSIEDMTKILAGRTYDCICINWVLHHLVGDGYRASRENCLRTLESCKSMLSPRGVLAVTEDLFDGYAGTDIPSRVIYAITSVRAPWFVKLARKYFNTAGVGVCFHSDTAWRRIFRGVGLEVLVLIPGSIWANLGLRRIAFPAMFIRTFMNGHYLLRALPGA